ncbi:MAG: NAD(P)/FAD-dependent oxidoreductase [Methanobacteriota archaeon]|nr:MAG: NAD(P)/FAD-dependent oxidoreductase [Euryarchaeota archaeon]
MAEAYDVVIVGGGHNGLVAATYLARARRRVLVLERRAAVGGPMTTEEIAPGFRGPTGASVCGRLRPEVVEDLHLEARGVQFIQPDPEVVALGEDRALRIWRDVRKTQEGLGSFSAKDAEAYPRMVEFLRQFAAALDPVLAMTPPSLPTPSLWEQMSLLRRALPLRRLGKPMMQQMLRLPPMSIRDFLNEWFETELLKASLAVDGLLGTFEGPFSPGTAFGLVPRFRPDVHGTASAFVRGGMGVLADAFAQAARDAGVTIRTGAEVTRIVSADGRVTGVEVSGGETIASRVVASNADPKRTFLHLVEPEELGPEFLNHVRNFEMNGVVANVNFALDGAPKLTLAGDGVPPHFRVCPSLEYIERAYDDAKYGRASADPFLDVTVPTVVDPDLAPPGKHVMSALIQYAPYALRRGTWETDRDKLGERVTAILEGHMPGLERLILHRQVLTPVDLEERFGLTEGHIYHGEMTLDQLLVLRPVPGWSRYRTPVEGLYLCGSGSHPGGGITGAPGYNAAREILKDWPRFSA